MRHFNLMNRFSALEPGINRCFSDILYRTLGRVEHSNE